LKNYAFVFARGGSKGLPSKNVKPLNGKPLIAFSIEVAKQSDLIGRVFVSTDDQIIADVARKAGAEVIDRPAKLAGDNSSEWLAWQHAIQYVKARYGSFDKFVSLPATSPLRALEDVDGAIVKHQESQADICITVTPASRSPFFNMIKHNEQGFASLVCPSENDITRRQDAPEVFDITTVAYVATPDFILSCNALFEGKVVSVVVPKNRAVDIDDIYDFKFAETLLMEQENERSA
jgi:N-acylneuraminate cytidylyltransferase